jgi:hypothetical protein
LAAREGIATSDILLLNDIPDSELPTSRAEAIAVMRGGTAISSGAPAAIYWEAYDLTPSTPVVLTIQLSSLDRPGFLARIARAFAGAGAAASRLVQFTVVPRQPELQQSLKIDMSGVPAGRYSLTIEAATNGTSGRATRVVVLR